MKKYDHVEDSIWLATSILTYNSYIKQRENNIIDATEFYFTQPEIIAKTESICTKDVHNARVSQHCNADSHDNTYNYLRAKDTLRRVTYIGEFNGDKEYPTRFDLSDKVDTLDGEKTIKEIVDFLSNDYKSIIKEYDNNKLLEILNFLKIYGKKSYKNPINETNPIEADVIIIDEMSMVDIFLMHSLLKAVAHGTRLVLVGDINQLASVGPGNVLKDMIASEQFNVVKLTHIFRQAAESDIIVNAHRIHRGEEIALDNKSKDFFCLKRDDSHGVLEVMLWLVRDRMPKYTHCTPFDVQVLTPMKKGELGVHRCNEVLQRYLNPEAPGKNQMELHGVLFREGDKVMQMKNNYQIKWEIRGYNHMMIEEGSGVFNGDCGIITEIDTFNKEVTVRFDDEKYVTYPQGNLDELELAYAITIHKSQGSEYPAVVLPILSGPRPLMNRNILYTAVTRGKKCVTIVGNKDTVREMIQNKSEQMRYSSLCRRLQELEQESLEK